MGVDYIAYLHKERGSDFGVSFPDFPGCITAGRTLEEAHRMAAEALALHIAGLTQDGEPIPEPSSLDSLARDPAMKNAVPFLVHVEPETEKTVRINITARQKQIEEIDRLAREAGLTRSAYLVQSALRRLPAKKRTWGKAGKDASAPKGRTAARRRDAKKGTRRVAV